MSRGMKGLDPIVATIILIAFAVAVGGLVALWLTNFATQTTEYTSEQGDKLTACAGARLKFDSVGTGSIVYSNPTTKLITNITVYDMNGRNLTFNATDMNPGQVSNITWIRASNTSIFMRGVCENAIVVEGQCKTGQVCWE
jgi:flagellin-like protein